MPSENEPFSFDASILQHQSHIPPQFIWPNEERPCREPPPRLEVPPIDLGGYLSGCPEAASNASRLVDRACREHGFFLVVNHGIDTKLIEEVHMGTDCFFGMPLVEKERALRKSGDHCGYASSFTGRFSSKLPWKETLSFRYSAERHLSNAVESYFSNVMGEDYAAFGYYIWKLNKMESFFFFFFILNVCFFFPYVCSLLVFSGGFARGIAKQ